MRKIKNKASIFFEDHPVQKWDLRSPIPYTFDASLAFTFFLLSFFWYIFYDLTFQPNLTKRRPKCFKGDRRKNLHSFRIPRHSTERISHKLSKGGQRDILRPLVYWESGASESSLSQLSVWKCEFPSQILLTARGIAMHETLHALGLNHEHLRSDRDQHVKIDWSNINPQHYDYFVIADSKLYTTYGIKYDYGSIMHYNAYMGALNIAKPTIIPKVDEAVNMGKLGQREKLSDADVEILNKMYCMPGCDDTNVYCGAWALKELCNHPNHKGWMEKNCQKSCNFCNFR
ncbi:shTK domain protein [Ostertagia ostertagi]